MGAHVNASQVIDIAIGWFVIAKKKAPFLIRLTYFLIAVVIMNTGLISVSSFIGNGRVQLAFPSTLKSTNPIKCIKTQFYLSVNYKSIIIFMWCVSLKSEKIYAT